MDEMNNLITLLAKADIPFEVRPFPSDVQGWRETLQILSPSVEDCKIDAIYLAGTYGSASGLIEVLDVSGDDGVGWLTAEEAVEHFRKALI